MESSRPFYEIMTDRPTDRPKDRTGDGKVPIKKIRESMWILKSISFDEGGDKEPPPPTYFKRMIHTRHTQPPINISVGIRELTLILASGLNTSSDSQRKIENLIFEYNI